jgi:hypothetical protein
MRRVICVGLAVIAMLASAQAPAQENVVTHNNVSFVSGGVGVDSEERLKAREKEFNLKLLFTLVEGNYLADVSVRVADAAGKTVIEHVADGPYFLAKLPAGTYSVAVTYEGKAQNRTIKVGGGLRTEHFRWPSNPQTDSTLAPEKGRK